jgi:hypothetical protein
MIVGLVVELFVTLIGALVSMVVWNASDALSSITHINYFDALAVLIIVTWIAVVAKYAVKNYTE